MAEEFNVSNVVQGTTAVHNLNDALSDTADATKSFLGQAQKIASVTKQMNPLLNMFDRLKRKVNQNAREFDDFETILTRTEKGVNSLSSAFTLAAFTNNKEAMLGINTMHRYAEQMFITAKNARALAVKIDENTARLHGNIIALVENKAAIDKLNISKEKLQEIETKLQNVQSGSAEYKAIVQGLAGEEKAAYDLILANKELTESTIKLRTETQANTDEYQKAQEELVSLKNRTLDAAEAQAMTNIEVRKMQGGMTALTASVEGIVKGKFFSQIRDLMSGATIVAGFALIAKGLSDIGEQAQKINQVALSLGDTSEASFGRFWKSGGEANKMAQALNDSAIRLGYSMDELNGVANKFTLGTKMDREGRLSVGAITALTQETARFAKVAGIDTAEAADMMDKRIRRFGMTAGEAVANMQEMRVTLMQMTAGMKGNMVDLGNMVKIIEEASEASQSYIVDTRLMTQALRGAVTQAQNLGMAQKQAQDVAKGLGKVLSTTPDYIKIPAGQALLQKLMGSPKDADAILMKLDVGTRKQVKAIMEGVENKSIGQYSAVQSIMALIGQSEAGIEAQMDQLSMVIGDSSEAAAIVKEAFQIENFATAQAITTMVKEAKKVQNAFKDEKISFSAAISKDAVLFNEAIEKAGNDKEQALKALEEKGASKDQAKEYLKIYDLRKMKEEELNALKGKNDDESKAKRIKIEREILEATKDQFVAVDNMLDPTKELMRDIEEWTDKPLDIEMPLDAETLKLAGIETARELGEKIGMDYEKNTEYLEKAMTKEGKKSIKELRENRIKASKMAEETRRQMEDISHFFADPIKGIEAGIKVFGNWLNLFGPWGKIVTGALLVMAGTSALWKGGSWLVQQGTYAALKTWGPNGPGGTGTGSSGKPELPGQKGSGGFNRGLTLGQAASVYAAGSIAYEAIDNATAKIDEHGERIKQAGDEEIGTLARVAEWIGGFGLSVASIGTLLATVGTGALVTFGTGLAALAAPVAVLAGVLLAAIAVGKGLDYFLSKWEKWGQFWDGLGDTKLVQNMMMDDAAIKLNLANAKQTELLNEKLKKKGLTDEEIKTAQSVGVGKYLRQKERGSFDSFSGQTPPSISTSIPATPTTMPEQNQSSIYPSLGQNSLKQREPLEAQGILVGNTAQLNITNFRSLISQHNKSTNALS